MAAPMSAPAQAMGDALLARLQAARIEFVTLTLLSLATAERGSSCGQAAG